MSDQSFPRLVALGNGVWLDEIRKEGTAPVKDVPGGSVTFGTGNSEPVLVASGKHEYD